MEKHKYEAYVATNLLTGDTYVGITRKGLKARWTQHLYHTKTSPRSYFHRAMAKYGVDNFSVQVVASAMGNEDAFCLERKLIQQYAPKYNLTNGGEATKGRRVPKEVYDRIAAKNRGKKRTPEMNAANSERKKRQLEENPEYKAKALSALEKARNAPGFRDKQKAAVSISSRNRVWRAESRRKLSEASKGTNRHSEAVRKQVAAKRCKMVECTTLNTIFDSVIEAGEMTGVHYSQVSKVCRGERKRANGLEFIFCN